MLYFYQRDAMLARYVLAIGLCLCVCMSVCLCVSHRTYCVKTAARIQVSPCVQISLNLRYSVFWEN